MKKLFVVATLLTQCQSELNSPSQLPRSTTVEDQTSAKPEYAMAALGDSVTAAFNAEHLGPNRNLSWATGSGNIDSVLAKLRRTKPDYNVTATNLSISRATSTLTPIQATLLKYKKIDYATIIIGSNDLCMSKINDQTGMDTFTTNIKTTISELVTQNPNIKIDLGAIPNLNHLHEIGSKIPHCKKRWDTLSFLCPPILKKDLTDEELKFFKSRWTLANYNINHVATMYPENVTFINRLAEPEFTTEHLSQIDCFHPNTKGLELIAQVFWELGWNKNQ